MAHKRDGKGMPGVRESEEQAEEARFEGWSHYEGQMCKEMSTVSDEGEYGNMNVGDFREEHNSMEVRRKTEEHVLKGNPGMRY